MFRPSFIALLVPLTEEDLTFIEKCFQRTLLVRNSATFSRHSQAGIRKVNILLWHSDCSMEEDWRDLRCWKGVFSLDAVVA